MNTPNIIIHAEPIPETHTRCEFCDAIEGEAHPMRGFIVELEHPVGYEDGPKACQVCRIHYRKREEGKLFDRSKVFLSRVMAAVAITLVIFSILAFTVA